ncbi:MAG: hypothetical protein IJY34_00870 [Clostridia bacterium]|nr:hypothetical protein [Clostridia bacterium]
MFGYVRPDTPYLYVKDQTLYQALYCGVCKGIGQSCGQMARFGLSYDVAFLSALLHNMLGQDVKVEKQHCLTHCIRVKQMAEVDELTKQLGALNTELAYYKCVDDLQDGDRGGGKKLLFARGHKRAQKAYPELCKIVREGMEGQAAVEKARTDSVDRAADPSATMIARLSDLFLGEKKSPDTYSLFYNLGKWIYLIDALDDYDKDLKKSSFNPFALAYGAKSKCELLETQKKELQFIFGTLFSDINEKMARVPMGFNRDLTDNVLLRGLPATTKKIMQAGTCSNCKKKRK